mgnify:FL=1
MLSVIVLSSCGGEENETVDLKDIIAESERYNEDSMNVKNDIDPKDTLAIQLKEFNENGLVFSEISAFADKYFPDRFGPITSEKYELQSEGNTFRFIEWKYQDSTKVMNAFFNWMDCFGDKCKSIFIGEERLFQANPFQILVNDSSLIFIEGIESYDFKMWESYFENKGYPLDWNYVIEQRKRGKAHWYNYIEEKKTPFKK